MDTPRQISRCERMEANCRILWGPGEYVIDLEYEDATAFYPYESWSTMVRRDFGDNFGLPLTMTPRTYRTAEAAWTELDRVLEGSARDAKRRPPVSEEEQRKIIAKDKEAAEAFNNNPNILMEGIEKVEKYRKEHPQPWEKAQA
ncbi:hypothetical protein K402DRAFT_464073 [Aulographum hederae CBS 113979]|uniref:Uncharacterized protein n=1 Tax=Aulographum hederae CBS 113979 TaxID=1176131 RepID=A0A6G1GY67_9PEZI|nr:hypothetical protein K402DRAFT_464073 [Aulographum hederae CBS 113979]